MLKSRHPTAYRISLSAARVAQRNFLAHDPRKRRTKPGQVLTTYVPETSPVRAATRFPERSQFRVGNEVIAPVELRSATNLSVVCRESIKRAGGSHIGAACSGGVARRGRPAGARRGERCAPGTDVSPARGGRTRPVGPIVTRLDRRGRLILKQVDKMPNLRGEHQDRAGDNEHSRPEDHGRARQVDDHPLSDPFMGNTGVGGHAAGPFRGGRGLAGPNVAGETSARWPRTRVIRKKRKPCRSSRFRPSRSDGQQGRQGTEPQKAKGMLTSREG